MLREIAHDINVNWADRLYQQHSQPSYILRELGGNFRCLDCPDGQPLLPTN